MRFKKVVPVMFLLLVILTISAVSATDDNSTSDTLTVDENPDEIQMDESNEGEDILLDNGSNSKSDPSFSVSADDIQYGEDAFIGFTLPHDATGNVSVTVDGRNFGLIVVDGSASLFIPNLEIGDHIVSAEYGGDSNYNPASNSTTFKVTDPYGFDALQSLIDATPEGDTLTLTNNYTCHGTPVTISRPITIDGDGYYLLSDSASQMIDIISDNVTLINLNMMSVVSGSDSAIIVNGKNCKVINSTFLNCSATSNGAAIYWSGSDGLILCSNFLFCSGNNGGAVYINALNCTVEESTFKMCNAEYGGAIYLSNGGVVSYCSFVNNSASVDGGAILSRDAVSNVYNSIFINNHASSNGGATYNCDNINCTFESNSNPQVYLDEKYRKNITIEVVTATSEVTVGENITIVVILSENITTNVTITFYGDDYVIHVENGICQLTVFPPTAGEFKVDVAFNGNEIYNATSASIIFLVNKKNAVMNISASYVVYGYDATVLIALPDDATGYVTLAFADGTVIVAKDLVDGKATFTIEDLAAGNYTVNATYKGDNNYAVPNASVGLTVAKATPEVTVQVTDIIYCANETIVVNVNTNGNVTIKVNGTVVGENIVLVNGKVELDVTGLGVGNYLVEVTYNGNENYTVATNTTSFNVNKVDVSVYVEVADISFGESEIINVTISNVNATGKVVINVDGKNYTIPVVNGSSHLLIPNLEIGDYIVSAEYGGDSNYNAAFNSTSSFKVTDSYGFDALQSLIDVTPEGGTLTLTNNYTCHSTPVTISRPITIDGDSYCLLSDSVSQMINIMSDNVTLINLNIMNVVSGNDSAIIVNGENCKVINSTFLNCSATSNGAAIYWNGAGGLISDSVFILCSGINGGAVYINALNCTVENSIFSKCNAQYGGAIYLIKGTTTVTCNNFTGNNAMDGGAIYALTQANIDHNNFDNNSALNVGGAIYVVVNNIVISYNNFTGNFADNGGAIYSPVANDRGVTISYSNFDKNHATYNGGAIYAGFIGSDGKQTTYCNFTDNYAAYGGAIYVANTDQKIQYCNFDGNNATYNGGSIFVAPYLSKTTVQNSTFKNSNADNGGAIYNEGSFTPIPTLLIVNDTFIKNTAVQKGGAVYNCKYYNCTFKDNSYPQVYNDEEHRRNTTIEISASNVIIGDKITVNVVFSDNITANVTLTFEEGNIDDSVLYVENGKGQLNISSTAAGSFKVTAIFNGDGEYLPVSGSTTFKVSKKDLTVDVNLDESEGVILITIPGDAGDVKFEINNITTTLTQSGKISIKEFRPEKYEYKIDCEGNDIYNPFSKTATLEIHRHIPEISVDSRDIQYGVTKNMGVVLPDNMANNVTLTLYYKGEILLNESKTLNQGIATLDVTGLDIGVYTVNVNYTGDINYYDFSRNITFSMLPKITYTSEITIEDDVEVILEFSNASGRVGLILNGEEDYLTQQIKNNKINFTFSTEDLFHGNHTIAFEYKGKSFDENLFNYFDSKTNTYRPIQYKLTILPQVFSVPKKLSSNDDGVVTLTFPDDAEGNLTVFVDGVEVMVKEVVNGIVTLDLSAYKDGNYKITFVYSGDRKYASFVQDSDANLHNTIPANIVASDFAVIYSAGTTYSVKVCTNSGKAVNNAKVIFFINGKAYKTVYTNSNGIAGAAISIAPGTYKITSNVNSLSNTKTLTVKHVIALKKVKVKRSAKKLILTASLKKVNGKYLKKKKVTFKFNGKKYKAKTNKKGVAKVTINKKVLKKLKKGKKVKYQATYLKDTVKRTVKVKK